MAYMHWPSCSRQCAVPYTPYSTRYHVITNTYCKFTCSCCYTHCAYLQCTCTHYTCTCIYSENTISVTVAGHDCLVNTYMYMYMYSIYMYVPQCTLMHVTCMCWLCMYMYIHGHDVGLHVQCACTCTWTCIYILCSQTTADVVFVCVCMWHVYTLNKKLCLWLHCVYNIYYYTCTPQLASHIFVLFPTESIPLTHRKTVHKHVYIYYT